MSSFVNLMDIVYPVGTIFITTDETSPAIRFGGTWEQIKDEFLLGASDDYTAGSSGGSMHHRHTIDEDKSRAAVGATGNDGASIGYYATSVQNDSYSSTTYYTLFSSGCTINSRLFNHHTKIYGRTNADNSYIPAYYAAYIWRRTA